MNLSLNTIGLALCLTGTLSLMGCHSDSDNANPPVSPNPVMPKPPVVIPPVAPDVTGQLIISDSAKDFKIVFTPQSDLNGVSLIASGNKSVEQISFYEPSIIRKESDLLSNAVTFALDENKNIFGAFISLPDYGDICGVAFDRVDGLFCSPKIKLEINETKNELNIRADSAYLDQESSASTKVMLALLGIPNPQPKGLNTQLNGKLTIHYKPNFFVLRKNRFPIKTVQGEIQLDGYSYQFDGSTGQPYYVTTSSVGGNSTFIQGFTASKSNNLKLTIRADQKDGFDVKIMNGDGLLGSEYFCDKPCTITSKIIDNIQQIDINTMFYKVDKNGLRTNNIPVKGSVVNPVLSGKVSIIYAKQSSDFTPLSYFLSAENNEAKYSFSNDSAISEWASIDVTVVDGEVTRLVVNTASKSDGSHEAFSCSSNTTTQCTGITLDSDGKTFHLKQTKLSGGVILNGTLRHAGA